MAYTDVVYGVTAAWFLTYSKLFPDNQAADVYVSDLIKFSNRWKHYNPE